MLRRYRLPALAAILAALVLALTACSGGEDKGGAADTAGKLEGPITLYDAQWESLWINNAIVELILEEGYGHEVDIAEVSTPIMQQSILEGDVDVAVELWCINYQEWCDRHTRAGDLVFAGTIFSDSEQGYYVPRYVVEGDKKRGIEASAPGLQSISDLPDHADVFADPDDPSKGLLISGIAGWEVTERNEAKVHAYDLDETYNTQQAGSSAALDGAITGAYERGEPVLFYYWAPSWIHAEFDLVRLDEPEWTQECQDLIDAAIEADVKQAPPEAGCAFAGGDVEKAVWPGLQDAAPDVVAFLERMHVGDEPMNQALAHMELEDVEPDAAALWYFEKYADDWRSWFEDDEVLERVEEALRERGADV
jgi:glycine betaine/proline transport system substrate-binding protein